MKVIRTENRAVVIGNGQFSFVRHTNGTVDILFNDIMISRCRTEAEAEQLLDNILDALMYNDLIKLEKGKILVRGKRDAS